MCRSRSLSLSLSLSLCLSLSLSLPRARALSISAQALRRALFVEDEPVASLATRLLEAPGAHALAKPDVVQHMLQRAALVCEPGHAPCLFSDVPGTARRRAVCAYMADLDSKGPGETRALALAALRAVKTEGAPKADAFVREVSASLDDLLSSS